jgi:N-glycosylase/DNA lyase
MIIDIPNVDIKGTLLSGSCFRTIEEKDGSITNILNDRIINLKQDGNKLFVKSSNMNNIKELIYEYFDLNRDYDEINKQLIEKNPKLKNMVLKCKDYRILNQNSFEMFISYIISQNNNVKRISNTIEKLSHDYGEKIIFENKEYYLFPKYEVLKKLTSEDFRKYGVGFRDKYLVDFINKYESLKDINNLDTKEALKELMTVKGIGLKVASCILLFGYKRLDVFPIDTWVKQYISTNYNIKNDQKSIEKFARDSFGEYSGLVIQYMFHVERNVED